MTLERKIYVNNDLDIVLARIQARDTAREMGFNTADQARISLAASELARVLCWNAERTGELVMTDAHRNGHSGLQVACVVSLEFVPVNATEDWAQEPSAVSRSLAGACHLVDESLVEECDCQLARVTLIKWLR